MGQERDLTYFTFVTYLFIKQISNLKNKYRSLDYIDNDITITTLVSTE